MPTLTDIEPLAAGDGGVPVEPTEPACALPDEAIAAAVGQTPPVALWKWLNCNEQRGLLRTITRGFQCTPRALRQTMVRHRLVDRLSKTPDLLDSLLARWGISAEVVADLRALSHDAVGEQLPALRRRHGAPALLAALRLEGRDDLCQTLLLTPEPPESDAQTTVTEPPDGGATARPVEAGAKAVGQHELAQRLERAQQSALKAQSVVGQLQNSLACSQEQARRFEREAEQLRKQEENRELAATAIQQELARRLDRAARKLKSLEAEVEETGAQNKRLQRQLRQQQQLNEELRKQLANQSSRVEGNGQDNRNGGPAKPMTAPCAAKMPAGTAATPGSPFDQVFVWKSDGRPFRVSPREVKRAIDCNDEEFVFALIQAFDALRETNLKGYRMFLDRIREFDRYYSRVLTADTTRVLVDASNVARHENNRYGKGKMGNLLAMREELRRRDCFPIHFYADASLPYHIDARETLFQMSKRGEIIITPSGHEADEHIAREARRTGAYVVTNDRNFHLKVSPDFEPPRIGFTISDGFVRVDDF